MNEKHLLIPGGLRVTTLLEKCIVLTPKGPPNTDTISSRKRTFAIKHQWIHQSDRQWNRFSQTVIKPDYYYYPNPIIIQRVSQSVKQSQSDSQTEGRSVRVNPSDILPVNASYSHMESTCQSVHCWSVSQEHIVSNYHRWPELIHCSLCRPWKWKALNNEELYNNLFQHLV